MSIPALTWADLQETGRPSWQAMIYVLAHNADQEFVAFRWWKSRDHWWPYLIKRTGLTRSSIFRVLKDMERVGLLHREIEEGKLVVTIHPNCVVRENAAGELESYHRTGEQLVLVASQAPEKSDSPQDVESDDETPKTASPTVGPNESYGRTPSIESQILESDSPTQTLPHPEQPPEESPPSQPSGEALPSQPAIPDWQNSREGQKLRDKFRSGYPDGILDLDKADQALRKLTPQETADCVEGVELYANRCKRLRQKPMRAHLFIAKRAWVGLLAAKPATRRSLTFELIPTSSPEGRAVASLYLMTHPGEPVRCHDERGRECYSVPAKPTHQVLAFAIVPSRRSQWDFYELHTPSCAAWRRFIEQTTGKGLAITSRGTRPGILAPHAWPPRVDGSWIESEGPSSTGPPQIPELTDDDIDALTG